MLLGLDAEGLRLNDLVPRLVGKNMEKSLLSYCELRLPEHIATPPLLSHVYTVYSCYAPCGHVQVPSHQFAMLLRRT